MSNEIQLLSISSGSVLFHPDGANEIVILTIPRPPEAQQPGVLIHLGLFQVWGGKPTIRPHGGVWGRLSGASRAVYWQVVTGNEPTDIEVRDTPEASYPPDARRLNWFMSIHTGVDTDNPHITDAPDPNEDPNARGLYFIQERTDKMPMDTTTNPLTPWQDPLPTGAGETNPSEWDILTQRLVDAEVIGTSSQSKIFSRFAIASADVNTLFPVAPPDLNARGSRWTIIGTRLRAGPELSPPTPLPPPGVVGATGSGSATPEWDAANHVIKNPLLARALTLDPAGTALIPVPPEDTPQPVALEATFNSVGACTTAIALFPAHPQFTPYEHALAFYLERRTITDTPAWWAGVIKDVQYESGLWRVELVGFWELLNSDVPILLNGTTFMAQPEHPAITGFIDLREESTPVPGRLGQTWSEYYRSMYAAEPNSNWGVGPDGVFIHGPPERAGVMAISVSDTPGILKVENSGYVFPPYVSTWWAKDPSGEPHVETNDHHGVFVPRHVVRTEYDSDENELVRPKEADYPIIAGPSSTVTYAGMCIPPLRIEDIPNTLEPSQLVASATVRITVGEEGSMPTVTTTLTTVALPYPTRGGG